MNTEKYKAGNVGVLKESNRSLYENKDSTSKSLIDKSRTHLNYNLAPHDLSAKEITEWHHSKRKKMRKDAIYFGGTVLTLPKDYTGNQQEFFEVAYEGLKEIYGLTDNEIISAYVHLDETTPHLHFYFLPLHREEGLETVSWEKVMPKSLYQSQHRLLENYMKEHGIDAHLLNGKTAGTDYSKLDKEERELSLQVAQLEQKVDSTQQALASALESRRVAVQESQRILNDAITIKEQATETAEKLATALQPRVSACNRMVRLVKAIASFIAEVFMPYVPKPLQSQKMMDLADFLKETKGMAKREHEEIEGLTEIVREVKPEFTPVGEQGEPLEPLPKEWEQDDMDDIER